MRQISLSPRTYLTNVPYWTLPHDFPKEDEGVRDPLRSQMVLDRIADGLFRSAEPEGPALTSLTDHLGYLAFHGWAEKLAGGSRTDCESWFVVLEPLKKPSH